LSKLKEEGLMFENVKGIPTEDFIGPLNDVEKKYSPSTIFYRGNRELFNNPRLAIVGTRKPSEQGIENTIKIAKFLVQNNVVIVSGLARGIDSVAHETAIKNGGATIAVIGTSIDKCYPPENADLQKRIAKDHLLISQFPEGYPTKTSNFPMRNRTMALLSNGTIIVEAGEKSGTIHQGWEALRLGRPLFILDTLLQNPKLEWAKKMIDYGAQPLSMKHLDKLLELIPLMINGVLGDVTF
jgi:DNA processing protein